MAAQITNSGQPDSRLEAGANVSPACPVCGTAHTSGKPIACPACGMENAPDAVFCANADCHKALGEFRYVQEELQHPPGWHESLADRITGFISKPHFYFFHAFWFALWIALNTGLIAIIHRFDQYPFALLGILLAAEAIFISGFILISQNRQNAFANKRAELDYEVNVRTYREIEALAKWARGVDARLARLEVEDLQPPRAHQEPEAFGENEPSGLVP